MSKWKKTLEIDENLKDYFNTLKPYKGLSKSEEHELLKEYKLNNNIEARNKVIESNLKYTAKLASAYRGKGVSYPELISEANRGLIESIDKFDLSKNVKLMSYAKWWIMQRMQDTLEKNNKIIECDLPEDNETQYDKDIDGISYKSVNKSSSDIFIYDDPEEETEDVSRFIDNVTAGLSDRECDIVNMYYGRNYGKQYTLEEIGNKYGLTKERTRQIMEAAFKKMRSEAVISSKKYVTR